MIRAQQETPRIQHSIIIFGLSSSPARRLEAVPAAVRLRPRVDRSRALADNVVAALRDPADAFGFELAVEAYEGASGSTLSATKTFAVPVGSRQYLTSSSGPSPTVRDGRLWRLDG